MKQAKNERRRRDEWATILGQRGLSERLAMGTSN